MALNLGRLDHLIDREAYRLYPERWVAEVTWETGSSWSWMPREADADLPPDGIELRSSRPAALDALEVRWARGQLERVELFDPGGPRTVVVPDGESGDVVIQGGREGVACVGRLQERAGGSHSRVHLVPGSEGMRIRNVRAHENAPRAHCRDQFRAPADAGAGGSQTREVR